jgi:hypothetical protein
MLLKVLNLHGSAADLLLACEQLSSGTRTASHRTPVVSDIVVFWSSLAPPTGPGPELDVGKCLRRKGPEVTRKAIYHALYHTHVLLHCLVAGVTAESSGSVDYRANRRLKRQPSLR